MASGRDSVPQHRESQPLRPALKVHYAFPIRPDPSAAVAEPEPELPRNQKRTKGNVFDAVAGRITTTHSLQAVKANPVLSLGDPLSARDSRLAPEEAYSRRKSGLARFEEFDPYFAHGTDRLSAHHKELPDSDMLKSIHAYTSRFYEAKAAERDMERIAAGKKPRSFKGSRLIDERSMNETALLAMGILLEEAGREVLGAKGDLAFAESAREEEKCFGTEMEARYADEPVPVVLRPVTNPFAEPGPALTQPVPVRPAIIRAVSSVPRESGRRKITASHSPGARGMSAATTASNTESRHSGASAADRSNSMAGEENSYQFMRRYPKETSKRKLSRGESDASDAA